MSLGDELNEVIGSTSRTVAAATAPRGWDARVEYDSQSGEGVTPPRPASDTPPSHAEILAEFGLDPAAWRVLTLRKSRWQAQSPEGPIWLEAYRATFAAISATDPAVVAADIEAIKAEIADWAPTGPARRSGPTPGPRAAFVVALSDWQLGKGENGGSQKTVKRILDGYNAAVSRLAQLRWLGYQIETVALVGLGDMVEQCLSAHYSMQTFQADLDMREQRKLAWRLALRGVQAFAPLATQVRVTGIAGNHGESRNEQGKAYTTFEDNDDLLLLDAIGDIVWASALENVSVELPADALAHVVELEGTLVGMVHGHQFRAGKTSADKVTQWMQGQMLGLQPIKDANILLNGHFHHLSVLEVSDSGRTFIQAPSMDGGSRWFSASSGQTSAPGMLTMLVGSELGPRQWDELKVV